MGFVQLPVLLVEVDPDRNLHIDVQTLKPSSARKVWWRCEAGHRWVATVYSRTRGAGCPYCAGRLPTAETSLATMFPDLAKQWHQTANLSLLPLQVTARSGRKVWWQCANGHEWQATVDSRARGAGCPFCAGRLPTDTHNLAVLWPLLAAQWHRTRNGDLTPEQVTPGSSRQVWWQCEVGHEWRTRVAARTHGRGCPDCFDRRYRATESLAHTHPQLAAQWHAERNTGLLPDQVTHGSNRPVWWQCEQGHEWRAMVVSRAGGDGCPYCAGRLATPTMNLQVLHPHLAAQWNAMRNNNVPATSIPATTSTRYWWRCEVGHEWQNSVANRAKGTRCPFCTGTRATPANNLATADPDLAGQWHPTNNLPLTPVQITSNSRQVVWWLCEHGHAWPAQIRNRRRGSGCPQCSPGATSREAGSIDR